MIIQFVAVISRIISRIYWLNFSTNNNLDCNAKDWVVYLVEALTGQNASFLSVASGSGQGSPPSSTGTYQESPTARARLASCPTVLPSIASRGELAPPVIVPVGSVVELTPADAIKYLSTFDHSDDTVHLPLAGNGGGDTPQQPLLPIDDLPQQPLPLTDDLPAEQVRSYEYTSFCSGPTGNVSSAHSQCN